MKSTFPTLLLPSGTLLLALSVHAQTAPSTTSPATTSQSPAATSAPHAGGPITPGQGPAASPAPAPKPLFRAGGFSFSGFLRSRYEKFDWFDAPNFNDSYGFTGTQLRLSALRSTPRLDIQIDGQGTLLTNLPRNSVAPPPQGALGLGANYFAANGSREGAVYVRQAFVRLKGLSGKGSFARLGRFEFNDGTETVAKNPTLAFLKTQRISQRLIGTFAFSHIGRAFDGAQFSSPTGKTGNFTAVVARPTQGVFQLDGNPEVKGTSFAYGAFTNSKPNSDVRLFGLIYDDTRDPPASVKVDNRPLAARTADNKAIRIYTIGANAI